MFLCVFEGFVIKIYKRKLENNSIDVLKIKQTLSSRIH